MVGRSLRYAEWLAGLERKGPEPVYVFCGPESLLRDQALRELKQRLADAAGRAPDQDRYQGGEVPLSQVAAALATVGLFSASRLVLLSDPEKCGRSGKKERQELFLRLRQAPAGSCFVAVSDLGLRELERKNEFTRGLLEVGRTVEFWHPRPADALHWMLGECERRGLRLSADAGEMLLRTVGPDLQELSRELEKLGLWAEPGETIAADRLRDLIRQGRVGTGWEFCDALVGGRVRDALRTWQAIRGLEPVLRILWTVQQRAREELARGASRSRAPYLGDLARRAYLLEWGIKSGGIPAGREEVALEGLIAALGRHSKETGPKGT
jgi:DNA polymerase III delta subunit